MANEMTVVIRFENECPMEWQVSNLIEDQFEDATVLTFDYEEDV